MGRVDGGSFESLRRARTHLLRRPAVLKSLLLVLSIAIGLGLSEIFARLALPAPQLVRVEPAPGLGARLVR